MNRQEKDILLCLKRVAFTNQRNLAELSGYSIGVVNRALKNLMGQGLITSGGELTGVAEDLLQQSRPQCAVILAAGFGMRMVPINTQVPKPLLEVEKEPLIERIIRQLHECNVNKIYIVVGFMKEQFEYLIDEYHVELIVNEEYASKNNLHSLFLGRKVLENTYIIPGDIRAKGNPFSCYELYSWYMVSDAIDYESDVRVNRKAELVRVLDNQGGNVMIGMAYVTAEDAERIVAQLELYDADRNYDNSFWEEILYRENKMAFPAKVVPSEGFVEINTYEQLRELDENSNHLQSDAISIIANTLGVKGNAIKSIEVLKKGMTNRSFLFSCKNRKYIMRIPGEGTDRLINRSEEAAVYQVISPKKICDDVLYIDSDSGYKITLFQENARVCDAKCADDLVKCMKVLREFHEKKLEVSHFFDLFSQIEFYESLFGEDGSIFRDYETTKENVFQLKQFIDQVPKTICLTHIDAVPDNFLLLEDGQIRLIDWEYAGMQDPHVDIAMFCIYSLYDRDQIDTLIDIYFEGKCDRIIRTKIYCYIAVCGLLWSNWCEYKRNVGVEFGEYSLRQYRYAKDYYKIAREEIAKCIKSKEP